MPRYTRFSRAGLNCSRMLWPQAEREGEDWERKTALAPGEASRIWEPRNLRSPRIPHGPQRPCLFKTRAPLASSYSHA